jgi:tetratricopeptide (TPR) repeat protein
VPLRRAVGATGFGVALWIAEAAGDPLIEPHDETTTAAGGHEELYVVLDGRATFTVGDQEVDAPAGACVLVELGTHRAAVAAEAGTRVLAIGGRPGAALPVSPFEYYYAAQPAYDAGDYDRAVAIASEGLRDWPDHPIIHYQLACYHALAGRLDEARRSLDIAFAGDERTRAWAAEDDDLSALRV